MEITILLIIFSILTFIGIFFWLLWMLLNQKTLFKSIFKSIKFKWFNFSTLIVFFGITISIVSGSMVASNRTTKTVEDIYDNHNAPHGVFNMKGLHVNTERMKTFHVIDDSQSNNTDLTSCLKFGICNINEYYKLGQNINHPDYVNWHWNRANKIAAINNVESYEDWATKVINNNPDYPTKDQVFLFNDSNVFDDDNRIAMIFYIVNTFHSYGVPVNNVTAQEFAFKPRMSYKGAVIDIPSHKESYSKVELVMLPNNNSQLNRSSIYGFKHKELNTISLVKDNDLIEDTDGNVTLMDDEMIIFDNFASSNGVDVRDIHKITTLSKTKDLEIVGTGYTPLEVNRKNPLSSKKDWKNQTVIYVNENTFYELLPNSILPSSGGTFDGLMGNSSISLEMYLGIKSIFELIDNSGFLNIFNYSFWSKISNMLYPIGQAIKMNILPSFNALLPPNTPAGTTNVELDNFGNSYEFAIDNKNYFNNYGFQDLINQIKLQQLFNFDMLFILVVINMFVVLLYMKRRIDDDKGNISSLKALGYRSSKISLAYAIIPLTLAFCGGMIGILAGFGVQEFWLNFTAGDFAAHYGSPSITYTIFNYSILIPGGLITIVTTILIYTILKLTTVADMSGEKTYQANFLIRFWGKISNENSNFIRSYKIKNILRQFGKSSFIVSSIVASSIIISFGTGLSSWGQSATNATQSVYGEMKNAKWYFDSSNSGNVPINYLDQNIIDEEIENGTRVPYTFGNPQSSTNSFLRILAAPIKGDQNREDLYKKEWSSNIGDYIATTSFENVYTSIGDFTLSNIDLGPWEIKINGETIATINKFPIVLAEGLQAFLDGATKINNIPWAIKKLFEWLAKPNPIFAILNNLASWSNGEEGSGLPRWPGNKQAVIDGSFELFNKLGEFLQLITSNTSMLPQMLHTLILSSQVSNSDITFIATNGKEYTLNLNSVNNALIQSLVINLLGSITNETILSIINSIAGSKNQIVFETQKSYITPGTVGVDPKYDGKFIFHLTNDNPTNWNGMIPTWTFDDDMSKISEPQTIYGNGFFEDSRYHDQNEGKIKDNDVPGISKSDNISYIPSYLDAPRYWDAIEDPNSEQSFRLNKYKFQTYNASLLDWSTEKYYGKEKIESNKNNNWKWEAINSGPRCITSDDYYSDTGVKGSGSLTKQFKRLPSGQFQVPVEFLTGTGKCATPAEQIKENAKRFGVTIKYIGAYETYFMLGPIIYSGDNGLKAFMRPNAYNAVGKEPRKDGSVPLFEKYQSLWSPSLTSIDPADRYLAFSNDSGIPNPIDSYSTPITMPVPISVVSLLVESNYKPFERLVSFFAISSYVLIGVLITLLTKEVIDETKKESLILKSMGYKNYTTTSLVMDGQGIVMLFSFIISIPISQLALSTMSTTLTNMIGLKFFLESQWSVFIVAFGILLSIVVMIYLIAYFLFKYISPLYALKNN